MPFWCLSSAGLQHEGRGVSFVSHVALSSLGGDWILSNVLAI